MTSPQEMSSTTRKIIEKVRQMVPPMLPKFHKGEMLCISDW